MAENVREIVAEYLKANGFDGLYSPGECGCLRDDLAPCCLGENLIDCLPGYKTKCPGSDPPDACDGDCEWHIGPTPEEPDNKESGV